MFKWMVCILLPMSLVACHRDNPLLHENVESVADNIQVAAIKASQSLAVFKSHDGSAYADCMQSKI